MALSDYTNEYDRTPKPLVAVTGAPDTQTTFGKVDAPEVVIMIGDRNLVDIIAALEAPAAG